MRYEYMQGLSLEELAHYLCAETERLMEDCDRCPVSALCGKGRNGFKVYLEGRA